MDILFASQESRPRTQNLMNPDVIRLWATVLLVICVRTALLYPHHDVFVTYVDAGRRWIESQALYSTSRGFVYSPLIAACFAPFSWLPGWMGAVLWRLLNVAIFFGAVFLWLKIGLHNRIPPTSYWLVFLLLLPFFLRTFNKCP